MIILRVPSRSVIPADFQGRQGICQNLNCLALLEPPYQSVQWCQPGGTLATILCSQCMPQPWDGTHPEMRLEVVAVNPVLTPPQAPRGPAPSISSIVPASQVAADLPPPMTNPPGKQKLKRRPSFRALVKREPRLLDLLDEARSHHGNREARFCANAVWYGYGDYWGRGIKERMIRLVGNLAQGETILRTSEAYDVAYDTIYQALPDCRGECFCG